MASYQGRGSVTNQPKSKHLLANLFRNLGSSDWLKIGIASGVVARGRCACGMVAVVRSIATAVIVRGRI